MKIKRQYTAGEKNTYFLYVFGFSFFTCLVGYLNLFSTDMGVSAIIVSGILVASQVWDAANDPVFGAIVDKRPFKGGKYKPWMRMGTVLIPLFAVLLFMVRSSWSTELKVVWVILFYFLYTTIYDAADIPSFGVVNVMTGSSQERTELLSLRSMAGTVSLILCTMLIPQLYTNLGWLPAAIIMSVIGVCFMIPFTFKLKERCNTEEEEQKTSLKTMLSTLIHNRYMLIFFAGMIVCQITNTIQTSSAFFARYCLGSDSYVTLIYLVVIIPTLIVAVFLPKICRYVDKYRLLMVCIVGYAVLSIVTWFTGYENLVVLLSVTFIRGLFYGTLQLLYYMFVPDFVEYGQYKSGVRTEGTTLSVQTFSSKFISGVCGSLNMAVLAAFGYMEGAVDVQPDSAVKGIWFCFSLLPVAGCVFGFIILLFYKLRDKDVQIMGEYNQGKITRNEAEEHFSRRY